MNRCRPGYLILFLCLLLSGQNMAQVADRKIHFNSDFSVPFVLTSPAYKAAFRGVYDIRVNGVWKFSNGIFTGPGFSYTLNKNGYNRYVPDPNQVLTQKQYSPEWHLGYSVFNGENFLSGLGAFYGYTFSDFNLNYADSLGFSNKVRYSSAGIYGYLRVYSGEDLSFGFNLGYRQLFYSYTPENYGHQLVMGSYNTNMKRPASGILYLGVGFSILSLPGKMKAPKN